MLKWGYSKLWVLRRSKNLGANQHELKTVYQQQIRCVVEFSAPVWAGAITVEASMKIERVQKCAFRIVLDNDYISYKIALHILNMET